MGAGATGAGAKPPGGAPGAANLHADRDREPDGDEEAEVGALTMEEGQVESSATGSSDEGSSEASSEDGGSGDQAGGDEQGTDEMSAGEEGGAGDEQSASGPQSAGPQTASGPQGASPQSASPQTASGPQTEASAQGASAQGASAQGASAQGASAQGASAQGASAQTGAQARSTRAQGGAATGDSGARAGAANGKTAATTTGKTAATTAGVDPPVKGTLTITSSPVHPAPGNSDPARTRIGVGEAVRLSGSYNGKWSTNRGKLQRKRGTDTTWTAPATAGTATIRFSGGGQLAEAKFTIIAPNHLSMKKKSEDTWPKGVQGVGMITDVTIGPSSVNFGNLEWLEVPGPASNITGYFTNYRGLYHHPNPKWLPWNSANTGLTDHASLFEWPRPWSPGGFQWNIRNKYRVTGEGGDGRVFVTTHQIFRMTNKKGTTTITKCGAKVTRTP